ncbi:hypothetical protein [Paracraurococcus lichenis]|uniref:Lipoprotein n=1 Tax=Paracraurococcus lichenis TaxID=3064888 RepID=A0ABT9E1X7_9PROT|nr:hypothetical protein [Paracraurococcus sp. LOR1-02]MDO9710166.1 hypothetical protein [Paracraurococcus sp. LOR1-02]
MSEFRRLSARCGVAALRLLSLLPLLAACAGDRSCGAVLANASGQPIEQFFLAPPGAGAWGADLLAAGELPPGGTLPFRVPGKGRYGIRAVWTDGRAVETQGVEACRITRVTIRDTALRME